MGAASAGLTVVGDTLLLPTLVLVVLVSGLTNSYLTIGAVPALGAAAWFLGQLVAAPVAAASGRKLPWATGAALVRAAALTLLATVVHRADRVSDTELLRSVLICFGACAFASSFGATLATEVYARSIPPIRTRLFFRVAQVWGAAAAVASGLIAARVLGSHGSDYPRNFSQLFVAAAVAGGGSVLLLLLIREPGRTLGGSRTRLAASGATGLLRGTGLSALGDATFRRFLVFRVALGLVAVADPFYIIFAQRELGIAATYLGWYVLAFVAARVASAPLWSWLTQRQGTRIALQLASLIRILPPLVAVLLPYLVDTEVWRDRATDDRAVPIAMGICFAALGVALAGLSAAGFGYVLETATASTRSGAITLSNLVLTIAAAAPIAGGVLLRETDADFERLFLTSAGIALVAILVGGLLTPARARPRVPATAWRLRRSA